MTEAPPQVFNGEWDEEGVWVYQAYNDAIADWAIEHQRLGGPQFKPERMTWAKPSFAWVLYRSGYGGKHNQGRILKIKLAHEAMARILSACQCKHGGGGSNGRVQWDPARDLMSSEGRAPRKMLRARAIQIGMKGQLSKFFVESALAIVDVTDVSAAVGQAHSAKDPGECAEAMQELLPALPEERPYLPRCTPEVLERLGMMPGATAQAVAGLGRGLVGVAR